MDILMNILMDILNQIRWIPLEIRWTPLRKKLALTFQQINNRNQSDRLQINRKRRKRNRRLLQISQKLQNIEIRRQGAHDPYLRELIRKPNEERNERHWSRNGKLKS